MPVIRGRLNKQGLQFVHHWPNVHQRRRQLSDAANDQGGNVSPTAEVRQRLWLSSERESDAEANDGGCLGQA